MRTLLAGCSLLLTFVVAPILPCPTAAAQRTADSTAFGFSFAVYGDSRSNIAGGPKGDGPKKQIEASQYPGSFAIHAPEREDP